KFSGSSVLDVTDVKVGQVETVHAHVKLAGVATRKVEPESLPTQESARLVRIPAAKDSMLLQQRLGAEVRHLTSASMMMRDSIDSTRRGWCDVLSCSFWIILGAPPDSVRPHQAQVVSKRRL